MPIETTIKNLINNSYNGFTMYSESSYIKPNSNSYAFFKSSSLDGKTILCYIENMSHKVYLIFNKSTDKLEYFTDSMEKYSDESTAKSIIAEIIGYPKNEEGSKFLYWQ